MGDRDSLGGHFFNHNWKDGPPPPAVTDKCHWCQLRLFPTHSQFPVTIVNETGDGAELPWGFRFIMKNDIRPGVDVAGASFRSGCSCDVDGACKYDGCACLEDMDWDEQAEQQTRGKKGNDSDSDSEPETRSGRASHVHNYYDLQNGRRGRRAKFAYHSRGRRAGLLRSRILATRDPIYECHEGCSCQAATCPNRVVERGRQIPLQIFRTADRGWGVRTLVDIERGEFVDCYLGEVITGREADRRRDAASRARRKDVYLFALDKFTDAASLDPRLRGPPLEVDGEFRAGPTRFVNHSCDPNTGIFARVGDHADKNMHDLALFAIKDIDAGEEITFDYINESEDMQSNARNPALMADMTPCLCKSKNCRGYLFKGS